LLRLKDLEKSVENPIASAKGKEYRSDQTRSDYTDSLKLEL